MVSIGDLRFTEWKDYFFNDYIIESCNNNILEIKENQLDNYDYTVKINEGEFFSFSKDRNDNNKNSENSVNSQNNENFEIKYLTPFQSDENAVHNEEENLFVAANNVLPYNQIEIKIENAQAKAEENKMTNNSLSENINEFSPDTNNIEEYRLKKKIDKETTDENIIIPEITNSSYNSNKKNNKLEIKISNDIALKSNTNGNIYSVVNNSVSKATDNPNQDTKIPENPCNDLKIYCISKDIKPKEEISNLIPKVEIKEFSEDDLEKNADSHIKKLQEKLQTLKFQNDIVMDENAKLLEILHLYKIIQSIESTEKDKYKQENKNDSMPKEITKVNNQLENIRNINDIDKTNNLKLFNNTSKLYLNQIIPISQETISKSKPNRNLKSIIATEKLNNSNNNLPKFKQFINKSNLNLINKKTYKQLHSNNDTISFSKTNISLSNNNTNNNYNPHQINSNMKQLINTSQIIKVNNHVEESESNNEIIDINSNRNKPSFLSLSNELNNESQLSDNIKNNISNLYINSSNRNNQFLEDLKKLENSQKASDSNDIKKSIDQIIITTSENNYNYKINKVDNNLTAKNNNDEIKNDEDFNKNYESIMNYFNKYREANAKVIENLILLEEKNENTFSSNKNRRKKILQNLEDFYKTNVEPKSKEIIPKDNSRYNMINSKSFSDKIIISENSHSQTNLKLIPFHLIEKKKLLINMMNYLYGKNIFDWKKHTIA